MERTLLLLMVTNPPTNGNYKFSRKKSNNEAAVGKSDEFQTRELAAGGMALERARLVALAGGQAPFGTRGKRKQKPQPHWLQRPKERAWNDSST